MMKVIGYWSYDLKDTDAVTEKTLKSEEIRKKEPKKFPKTIFNPHFLLGGPNGFTIFEAENEDQLSELVMHYYPVLTWEFVPIVENTKLMTLYQKTKK
jgi:hypothetical protein